MCDVSYGILGVGLSLSSVVASITVHVISFIISVISVAVSDVLSTIPICISVLLVVVSPVDIIPLSLTSWSIALSLVFSLGDVSAIRFSSLYISFSDISISSCCSSNSRLMYSLIYGLLSNRILFVLADSYVTPGISSKISFYCC